MPLFTIGIGYGLAVLIEWGFLMYFCFVEGKLFIIELIIIIRRYYIRSYSYLSPVCTIQPIQAPASYSIGLVLAYCRSLDRDRYLPI